MSWVPGPFTRDTAAGFAALNPLLADTEVSITTDTQVLKIGDGVTLYNDLVGYAQEREAYFEPVTTILGPWSTATDIPGLSITLTADGLRPVFLSLDVAAFTFDTGCSCIITIQEGSDILQTVPHNASPYGYWFFPGSRSGVQVTPEAGEHTYKVTITPTGGAVYVLASPAAPSFIRATEGR